MVSNYVETVELNIARDTLVSNEIVSKAKENNLRVETPDVLMVDTLENDFGDTHT